MARIRDVSEYPGNSNTPSSYQGALAALWCVRLRLPGIQVGVEQAKSDAAEPELWLAQETLNDPPVY